MIDDKFIEGFRKHIESLISNSRHTRAPTIMQQCTQFVNEYEQIISTFHDYKNNFELLFKQAVVLKFSVNAKMLTVSHIHCDNLLVDADLNKKLEHFFFV